MYMCVKETGK